MQESDKLYGLSRSKPSKTPQTLLTFSRSKVHCEAHLRTLEAQGLRALALGRHLDKAREIETYLRDTAGSFPDHRNKASTGIPQR